MGLFAKLKRKALGAILPLPFDGRHVEYSAIAAADDDPGRPSSRLIDISLQAIQHARQLDLSWLSRRLPSDPRYPDIWPGEHYKLLVALVSTLRPKRVIEIGTCQGLSALALKASLEPTAELITLDIVPWKEIGGAVFEPADFADGRMRQVIGDLSDAAFFASFAPMLSGCDLLFVDGPKDVVFEKKFLDLLAGIQLPASALIVFDDIRVWNMLEIWRSIRRPKLDLTSFGHWSGTGLVDWSG